MRASETFGRSKIVSKRFTNLEQRSNTLVSSLEFVPERTMSMDLTEPDAGSDLQSVMLKATYCEEDGTWRLNGVKRFITNGDADIH